MLNRGIKVYNISFSSGLRVAAHMLYNMDVP